MRQAQVDSKLTFAKFRAVFLRFWPFVARYRSKYLLCLLLILIAVPLGQFSVLLTRDLTDRSLLAVDQPAAVRWTILWQIIGLQAAFWLLSSLLATAREVLEWYLSMRSTYDLRMAYFRQLYKLPLSFLLQRPPGEHVYRATEDIGPRDGDGYAPGLMGVIARMTPQLFEALYAVLWSGILLYLLEPVLALLLLVYIVPFSVCAHLMYDKMRKTSLEMRAYAETEAAILRDSVAGLRTLKSMGRWNLQRRIYARSAADTKRLQNLLSFQTIVTTQGVVWSLRWAFQILLFVIMAKRVIDGYATVGAWIASTLLILEAQNPLEKAVQLVQQMRMQMVPAQRVLETLDAEPDIPDVPNAVRLEQLEGHIAYHDVAFSYVEGLPVLQGADLVVPANAHVGIVGPSGAGKSSLIGLLLRTYRPSSGTVTVDGIPVDQIQIESLLAQCGVVLQTTFIYTGTIRENVLYGNPYATESEFERACAQAGVDLLAARQPLGYETVIGEGETLSGGERQRIGIARALIRNPRILILDEATASLDTQTEQAILTQIRDAIRGRTTITIAHRLKATMGCHCIYVMNEGRVAESGTHQDLLNLRGLYWQLWNEQEQPAAYTRGLND